MRRMLLSLSVLTLAACQTANDAMPPPEPIAARAQAPLTPLPTGILIDGRVLLPPPPVLGSAADRADLAIAQGPWSEARIDQARQDSAIDPFAAFDNVLGADFTAVRFPATAILLRRVTAGAGAASQPPKDLYQRPRPFMRIAGHPTCVDPTPLRGNGSYPSGHTAIGFAWGLTLAEMLPTRADALVARGIDFGQSRIVCGVHWNSDVETGRTIGAAVFARLQSEAGFQAELTAARAELAAAYPN